MELRRLGVKRAEWSESQLTRRTKGKAIEDLQRAADDAERCNTPYRCPVCKHERPQQLDGYSGEEGRLGECGRREQLDASPDEVAGFLKLSRGAGDDDDDSSSDLEQ